MAETSPSAFVFETEFTPDGDVIGGAAPRYLPVGEAEAMAAKAAQSAVQTAEVNAVTAAEGAMKRLTPTAQQLAQIADQLRREAAELAMAAARAVAGAALDRMGAEVAAEAVQSVVGNLKAKPMILISAAPGAVELIRERIGDMREAGPGVSVRIVPDASARPGDWRVEWDEGATGFKSEDIQAAVETALNERLQDPVGPQLDLFSAA
ncbi:MAG: FliH/SctL family protein [Hyphomonadaceae bacterium]